jgi:hypothetical protein
VTTDALVHNLDASNKKPIKGKEKQNDFLRKVFEHQECKGTQQKIAKNAKKRKSNSFIRFIQVFLPFAFLCDPGVQNSSRFGMVGPLGLEPRTKAL